MHACVGVLSGREFQRLFATWAVRFRVRRAVASSERACVIGSSLGFEAFFVAISTGLGSLGVEMDVCGSLQL